MTSMIARLGGVCALLISLALPAFNPLTPDIKNNGSYKNTLETEGSLNHLFGHVPAAVKTAQKIQAVEGQRLLKLALVLPLNNEEELDHRLLSILGAENPGHGEYLTQQEFLDRHAPTMEQVGQVITYLKSHGIKVLRVSQNRLIVHALASVSSINKLFHTEIAYFADKQGSEFYAPAYELQISKDLSIKSVQGLENYFRAQPSVKAKKPSHKPKITDIQGLTPEAIKTAYSLTGSQDGSGQTVALFELDGFDANDIQAYQNQFNLPNVSINTILVDDATGTPTANQAQVTTDIELMMAMAPGVSEIRVYEGPNTATGILDTYNQIAVDNVAKSISSSWGADESATPGSLIIAEALVFKQMVAQGQSLFVASGNNGAYIDGVNLGVQDPASQPLTIAVGGTSLSVNVDGSYNNETTWFDSNNNIGSGGGVSSVWHAAGWQQRVVGDGGASYDFRNVPDVSLNADPNSGYALYTNGAWGVYGGTGAAATLWAGFIALVNQQLVSNGHNVIGLPAQFLYQAGLDDNYQSLFHDIADNSTNGYYPAIWGYDVATGLGSLNADALLNYFTTATPPVNTCVRNNPSLIITPSTQIGKAGDGLVYSVYISNLDNNPCGLADFALSATLPNGYSISFDQPSVTIQPNTSTTVYATITSPANSTAGTNSFTLTATNQSDTNYQSSSNGSYQILGPRGPGLEITVDALNGNNFYPSLASFASFQVILTNDQDGIANQETTLVVEGPDYYYEATLFTGNDGSYLYNILIDQGLPLGSYTISVSSTYNGDTVSAQTQFHVDLPFPTVGQ